MATSNGSTLSTFSLAQSCPIHFGPLKDARSLPCGHTFCLECLKPYASTNRVVCPLCNATHKADIYLLPPVQSPGSLGRGLMTALPSSADEYVAKSKALATENELKNVESACDMVIELLENMKNDFREMKSSFEQKRQSLADELKQMESNLKASATEEDKAAESKNMVNICDMFQRVCAMAQDRALHKILQVSKEIENVSQQVKTIGICRYYVDSELDLDADREQEIIQCLASLAQRHATSEDYGALCDSMITVFTQKLSNEYRGTWTAVVGDRSLSWNVSSTLLVQGETSNLKMIIYCCKESTGKEGTHKLGMAVTQAKFKSIIESECKEENADDQDQISRIAKRVMDEFGGKWHCIAGTLEKYIIKSTGDRNFLLKYEHDGREYACWKY